MASFIRPQARAALWRWRECLAGVGLIAIGVLTLPEYGLLRWVGNALIGLGVIAILTGLPRARFRRDETGAGVITVTEHQLTYMGPLTGGSVSIDHIYGVALDHQAWILTDIEDNTLTIPLTATGSEQLFDVFETLPRFPTSKMLRALDAPRSSRITIWRRGTQPIDTALNSPHLG